MKVRTGPGPLDWRDEGPQSARASLNHFAVSAVTGSAMVPIMTSGEALPLTAAQRERRRWRRRETVRKERPVCGAFMPLAETTCARNPGHRDSHRSREVMDNDMAVRRASETVQ